ncbi:DUF4145 domain-containing protein [Burkholderia contaminans]|uniref:DUF4145 domain-containing protein n=1 Tax=Burkholderia contaminans TaxID=488447 RepID=A0A3N8RC23_9BURK|nr:DUF4145 domain-containing protein [Burkholderia contaminans]RQT33458.1 DUF4145 domain-containing protein [Burkholderia contaminans]
MAQHYPAEFHSTQFNCIHCGVFSVQHWHRMLWKPAGALNLIVNSLWDVCTCMHCSEDSYWYDGKMLVPSTSNVSLPHEDFPEEPRNDYNEARAIYGRSPRAATALLRLALQKLLKAVGQKGDNINNDIAALVKAGLSAHVQQALDYCRVIGNNAVHPGVIRLDDTPEMGIVLFEMLNLIVEQLIAQPKRVENYYTSLPEAARAAIEKRDAPVAEKAVSPDAGPAAMAGPAK